MLVSFFYKKSLEKTTDCRAFEGILVSLVTFLNFLTREKNNMYIYKRNRKNPTKVTKRSLNPIEMGIFASEKR